MGRIRKTPIPMPPPGVTCSDMAHGTYYHRSDIKSHVIYTRTMNANRVVFFDNGRIGTFTEKEDKETWRTARFRQVPPNTPPIVIEQVACIAL